MRRLQSVMERMGQLDHSAGLCVVRVGTVLGLICSWLAPVICSAEAPRTPMVDGQLHATESASTDVEPGEFYRSGTRIGMTAGASFLIPPAWQGVLPPGSRTFYLESPKKPGNWAGGHYSKRHTGGT